MIAPAQIAFVRGTTTLSVWVAESNGRDPRRIGRGDDPLLSPNGKLVAFVQQTRDGTQVAIRSTGPGGTNAGGGFGGSSTGDMPVAWSPDSRYLAVVYTGTRASESGLGVLGVGRPGSLSIGGVATGYIEGASFAPTGADRLVYARAPSLRGGAPVNLYAVGADGSDPRQLTHDGRSLNPVWGRTGIAYDRERMRGVSSYPEYQVWLLRGSRSHQITRLRVPRLDEGLVPLGFSASGNRLIAAYEGEDTENAWTVQLAPLRVRQIMVRGRSAQPAAISADGRSLLVYQGAFERPPSHGRVESLPFVGGKARVLTIGASPTWDR